MPDIRELKEEELEKATGGNDGSIDNPKGLVPEQSIYFYNCEWFVWMWGTFKDYQYGRYIIEWNDTTIFIGDITLEIPASFTYVTEDDME